MAHPRYRVHPEDAGECCVRPLAAGVADRLRESFRFYDWDASTGEVRWVCSFDTQPEDVDAFVAEAARLTSS